MKYYIIHLSCCSLSLLVHWDNTNKPFTRSHKDPFQTLFQSVMFVTAISFTFH